MIREVLDVMAELSAEGMTSIVVTHEMGFARRAADHIVFMEAARSSRTRRASNSSAARSMTRRAASSTRSCTEIVPGVDNDHLSRRRPHEARSRGPGRHRHGKSAGPRDRGRAPSCATCCAEGFDVTLSEYKPGRVNVVARLANGAGPVFAFNTHMDVVPAGEGWSSDPFTLREADGRLYGRGACDCKGPLIAMVEAMRMLAADRAAWSGTLLGVFVADEEIASEGAKFYAASRPHIDYAVVGEPTSNATFTAHKGSLRPVVRVHGVSAHSGTPHLGENAIYRAGELLGLIAEHHENVVRHRTHPLVGAASLTVTRIPADMPTMCCPAPATCCSTAAWCRARTKRR